jgi:hypothetical protein
MTARMHASVDCFVDGWIAVPIDGWINGWMDAYTDDCADACSEGWLR